MLQLFENVGLVVQRAHGLGYMPNTGQTRTWHPEELAENKGIYAAVEQCYSLAYVAARR